MTRASIHASAAATPGALWRPRDATILTGALSRLRVRALGDEGRRSLPGDAVVPDSSGQWTNAITIRARRADTWPWLLQMGCTRAGWYSYDNLDNGWPARHGRRMDRGRLLPALLGVQGGLKRRDPGGDRRPVRAGRQRLGGCERADGRDPAFDGFWLLLSQLFAMFGTDASEPGWRVVDTAVVIKRLIGTLAAAVGALAVTAGATDEHISDAIAKP